MTIKELKEAISNLPDDGEVYVQRIEDKYFEKHGWSVKLMRGEEYFRMKNLHTSGKRWVNLDSYKEPQEYKQA